MIASPPRTLSWREYIAWLLATAVVATASAFVTLWYSDCVWPSDMARFEGEAVTIEAPRIGAQSTSMYTFVWTREFARCRG